MGNPRTIILPVMLICLAVAVYLTLGTVIQHSAATTCREADRMLQIGNPLRARESLNWLLWFEPDHPEALYIVGRSFLREKDYSAAIGCLTRVGKQSFIHRNAHLARIAAMLADFQMENAERALRDHLSQYPDDFKALTQLHGLLLAQFRVEAACDLLVAEIRDDNFQHLPVDQQLTKLRMLAKAEFDAGSATSCLPLLLESYDHHPNQSSVALAIGICSWRSGDFDRARRSFKEAYQNCDDALEITLAESEFLLEKGDLETSRSLLDQLSDGTKSVSDNAKYHRLKSRLADQSGEHEIALTHAMQALKLHPADRELHSRVARLLQKTGKIAEARESYARSHGLAKNEIALWNLTRTLPEIPTIDDCERVAALYEQLGRMVQARAWSAIATRLKNPTIDGDDQEPQ